MNTNFVYSKYGKIAVILLENPTFLYALVKPGLWVR